MTQQPELVTFFFLMIWPPPTSTLFPYTTLFRSLYDRNPQRFVDNIFLARDSDYTAATQRIFRSSRDRKSTRLNSSHTVISYAVFCLKKKKTYPKTQTIRKQMRLAEKQICILRST